MSRKKQRNKTKPLLVPEGEAPTTEQSTALAKQDSVKLETVRNRDGKDRLAARSASGKFEAVGDATVLDTQKLARKIFHTEKDEEGKSALERIIRKNNQIAEENDSAKNLLAVSHWVKGMTELTGEAAAREAMLRDNSHVQQPVKMVIIAQPVLLNPEVIDFDAELLRREEERRSGPRFIDAEIRTNPPQDPSK